MSQMIKLITPQEAQKLLEGSEKNLLDIRQRQDFQKKHVAFSTCVDDSNISEILSSINLDEPVAIICYHGKSSQQFAAYMGELGYCNVASVIGGIEAWAQQLPNTL